MKNLNKFNPSVAIEATPISKCQENSSFKLRGYPCCCHGGKLAARLISTPFSFVTNLSKATTKKILRLPFFGLIGLTFLFNIFALGNATACTVSNLAACPWFNLILLPGSKDTILVDNGNSYPSIRYRYQRITTIDPVPVYTHKYIVSERLTGENWTVSGEISSAAAQTHYPEVNASAIRMDVGAKRFGYWYAIGNANAVHDSSRRFTYIPTANLVNNIPKGKQLEVKIEVKLYARNQGGSTEHHQKTKSYVATIIHFDSLNLAWEENSSSNIVPDGSSNYGESDGLIQIAPAGKIALQFGGYEVKPSGIRTLATVGNTREISSKYSGWEVPVGENLQYGAFYISSNRDKFFFRPNSVEINKLQESEIAVSILEMTPVNNDGEPLAGKTFIRMTLGKLGISVDWGSEIELDSQGNPVFTFDHASELEDLQARLAVVKIKSDYFSGGAHDLLNGQARINGNNIEAYELDPSPGIDVSHTRFYGTGWSNGNNRLRAGFWMFDGRNNLVFFRPLKDRLVELKPGDVVETYLTLSIVRGPTNNRLFLSNKTMKITIRRAEPVKVSINNVTLAEDSGSANTEFRFKVSIDSKTAIGETFTVPVTFSHDSTNDEDFVDQQNLSNLDVTFGAGDKEKFIPILIEKDVTKEPDETFRLTLSEPTGDAKDKKYIILSTDFGANVGIGTIIDEDRTLVSIDDITLAEGNATGGTLFQFTVSLTPATALNQTFRVPVTFTHITTNSSDFVGTTDPTINNLNFGTDSTSRTIDIMVNQDTIGEEDEMFTLTLSEPIGDAKNMNLVTLDKSQGASVGTGIITDDDLSQMVNFSWDPGFDGVIRFDGITFQPGYQLGRLSSSHPGTVVTTGDSGIEKRGAETLNTYNQGTFTSHDYINDSIYPGFVVASGVNAAFDRAEKQLGSNFTYGTWYRKGTTGCAEGFCADLLFIPNVANISKLTEGDVISSTHNFLINQDGVEIDSRPTTVTIIVDTSKHSVGFKYENRIVDVAESETAQVIVSMNSALDNPLTIPFTITPGTAKLNSDFSLPPSLAVTIPAGETRGMISIPIIEDMDVEDTEEFTVSLRDGNGYAISSEASTSTVRIIDNDPPVIVEPSTQKCHEVTKPAGVTTPNTEAFWFRGAPEVDGMPVVYQTAGNPFDVRIGFRDPVSKIGSTPNAANTFYFAIYYDNGKPENPGIPKTAQSSWGGVGHRIGEPRNFRGYLRYRILPRNSNNNSWYHVGTPCEFHLWWTDANRPGITITADETVKEGKAFRVTATATPKPNRDILVPISLSDDPRIAGERSFNIRIRAGQKSGHVDVLTNQVPNDQPADTITASTKWRSNFWLDNTKKSATIAIEDHEKKIVSFKNSNPDIVVGETGNAELVVKFDGTNSSGVTVKYRIDDVGMDDFRTDASDYTVPANSEIRIASGSEGTISIPINPDTDFENSETFTVTLIENDDALPADSNIVATVTIVSDDAPPLPPSGNSCDSVSQPQGTTVINTQANWKQPLPNIYQETNTEFTAQMRFRDPLTRQTADINMTTLFKIGIYHLDGSVENDSDGIGRTPMVKTDHLDFPLRSPRDYTGFLNYRINASNETNNEWYDIGTPCEFPIWWTKASKPGIALSIDKKFVVEGSSFRVIATATPEPNRDILVPISLSDTSRIEESQIYMIRIAAGQETGYTDIQTKILPGDQSADDLTVSAEWRSTYWMDRTVSSRAISITEFSVPELSIRSDGAVTEADIFAASFTVTSDSDPGDNTAIEVHYTPVDTGNFLVAPVPDLATRTNNGHVSGEVTKAALTFLDKSAAGDGSGPFEALLSIPLRGNANSDTEIRSVTVQLNDDAEGSDYEVSTTNARAVVNIIDDDSLPVLTLEADNNPAEFDEPESAGDLTFKVTAAAMPHDAYPETNGVVEIDVRYSIAQTGNFINLADSGISLAEQNSAKLIFADSNGIVTADLAVPIVPDFIEEPSGSISITLLVADTREYYYVLGEDAAKNTHTVKVYDNDEPELSIAIADANFVEGSATHVQFTVTSRFTVDSPFMVNFKAEEFEQSTPDTPSDQNEFLGTNTSPVTLDFSGSTTQTLNIAIEDDSTKESSDRLVRITLLDGSNYSVSDADDGGSASVVVADDDSEPLISVAGPASVAESDEKVVFTVSSLIDPGTITVNFALSDDDTEDYLTDTEAMRSSEILSLEDSDADGTYTDVISVTLDNDTETERTGVIALELTANASQYRLGIGSTATVTVYDDDAPELAIFDGNSITEGDPGDTVTADFIVESQVLPNRGESDEGQLAVQYTPVSVNFLESAVSGTRATENLRFADASGSGAGPFRAILAIPIQNDTEEEANGTITVTLADEATPGTSYFVVDSATNKHSAAVMVSDNDSVVVLSIADAYGLEGTTEDGFVEFRVIATKQITSEFTVEWVINSGSTLGTADLQDFVAPSLPHTDTVTFAVSETDGSTPAFMPVRVPISADGDNEGDETFTMTLTRVTSTEAASVSISTTEGSATGTIHDDEQAILSITSISKLEGTGTGSTTFRFAVNLFPPVALNQTFKVPVAFDRGTTNAQDFINNVLPQIPTELDFAADVTSETIEVRVKRDDVSESDESFILTISEPTGDAKDSNLVRLSPVRGANVGTGTIKNDDGIVVSIADAQGFEGTGTNGSVDFTIAATAAFDQSFAVTWEVAGVTADAADFFNQTTPTFSDSTEFELTSGATGLSMPISIPIMADDVAEPDETFTITLTGVTGAGAASVAISATKRQATGTIRNDDQAEVAIDNLTIDIPAVVYAYESSGIAAITLESNGLPAEAVAMTASTIAIPETEIDSNLIAEAGEDYTAFAAREFELANDNTNTTLTVAIIADTVIEQNEKFRVEIGTTSSATILGADATGRKLVDVVILDDDEYPTVELTAVNPTVAEGDAVEFAIVAKSQDELNAGVEVQFRIAQTGDYLVWPVSETIVVTNQLKMVRLPTLDDNTDNQGGSVTLTLQEGTEYLRHPGKHTATVAVTDNDNGAASSPEVLYSVVSIVITEILQSSNQTETLGTGVEPTPTVVAITAVEQVVSEGDPIRIAVSVDPAVEVGIEVNLRLEESGDYLGGRRSLTVAVPAGSTAAVGEIPTVNDNLAEADGIVTVSIQDNEEYSIGSPAMVDITVTDALDNAARRQQLAAANQVALPAIAGSIGARSQGAMSHRMAQAFASATDPVLELGGLSSVPELLKSGGDALNGEEVSWQTVLGDSSFQIDLLPEANGTRMGSIWGLGDFRNLAGERNSNTGLSDGEVFTGHIGFDLLYGKEFVTGLTTSVTNAEMNYGQDRGKISYQGRMTGVHPYFGFESATGNNQLHVIAGYGLGELELEQTGYAAELLESTFYNVGVSSESQLYANQSFLGGLGQIDITGDSWLARQFLKNENGFVEGLSTSAGYLRIALAGTQEFKLDSGEQVGPNTSIGLRADTKGQQTFIGMELTGGLEYQHPFGLELGGNSAMVGTNELQVSELGVSGAVNFDQGRDGLGFILNAFREWGWQYKEIDNPLWRGELQNRNSTISTASNARFDAEVGYGMQLDDAIGLLTPTAGFQLTDESSQYRVGFNLRQDQTVDLRLESVRQIASTEKPDHSIRLDGSVNW